jgi:ATP adenylyltransferase
MSREPGEAFADRWQTCRPVLTFNLLRDFVYRGMRMGHVYQPLVIRTLLEAGRTATVRQLAVEFQQLNEQQIRRMEKRIRHMPP